MNKSNAYFLKKSVVSSAIATALSIGMVPNSQADIYNFTFSNDGCTAGVAQSCHGGVDFLDRGTDGIDADTDVDESSDAFFTMLSPSGAVLQNSSVPYNLHYYWYGFRTPLDGNITVDINSVTGTGTGVATINGFDFYSAGPAVASGITMTDIGDGNGDPTTGDLWLGNMLFAWNNNNGIPVSIVWNMSGLMTAIGTLDVNNDIGTTISGGPGVGVLPASNNMQVTADLNGDTTIEIGNVLIATSIHNTTSLCTPQQLVAPYHTPSDSPPGCMTVNPSGSIPALTDSTPNTNPNPDETGIGGTPMIDGPFSGFNANFDFKRLTLAGYNDTTPPEITFGGSVSVPVNGSFDPNNPGVTVTCTDNADGTEELVTGGNANISFTVVSSTVNTAVEGNYAVTYTCTDNAGARAALADDPNNPGNPTVPADNTSANAVLTVVVGDPNRPVITVLGSNPLTHQACTAYTDPGATATDLQEGDLTGSIVVGGDTVDATTNEGSYSITYDVDDTNNPLNPSNTILSAIQQVRTVNVIDTAAPILTVTGGNAFNIESSACGTYVKPVATVVDANGNCNPPASSTVTTSSTLTCVVPNGQDTIQSTLLYSAADTAAAPNTGNASATVTVSRSEPVITLNGGGLILAVNEPYVEPGMDIHDVQDGDVNDVTASGSSSGLTYTIVSPVDTSVAGTYTVTYDVTDSDGNAAAQVTRSVQVGAFAQGSNFTMLTPDGQTFGGTNDVVFNWDGVTFNTNESDNDFTIMEIYSALPQPFFSYVWTAHHIRVFGPGTYTFDATCTVAQLEAGTAVCNNPLGSGQTQQFLTMTVGAGQIGVHILFDWHGNNNIDVINVWDQNAVWNDPDGSASVVNNLFMGEAGNPPDPSSTWDLVSTDPDGDGINGVPMVDGPFIGYNATFNANPSGTGTIPVIQVTAPSTKLGSGSMSIGMLLVSLFSLLGLGLYRKAK